MVMCFVPGCNHYSERRTCKFLIFPANATEKKRWISLIRRKDREPSKHSLICSCHFLNMDRKNGPTIFEFNAKKKFNFEPPEKRTRRVKSEKVDFSISPKTSDTEIAGTLTSAVKIEASTTSICESGEIKIEDTPLISS